MTSTLNISDGSAFASRKPRKLSLTNDNSKILGRSVELRRQKTAPPTQYPGRNLKTHNSTWTPVVHKPSNQQIFKERCNLISHWFDLWTDIQQKEFLVLILEQCHRSQYIFVQDWFQERIPLLHLDFTKVLPRFLSLKIFSYLEPKNLCRAARVCWHWKFIADQDILWRARCIRYGWFLPYTPEESELGAWKRHYIGCVKTLDYVVIGNQFNEMYGSRSAGLTGRGKTTKKRVKNALTPAISRYILDAREPWQGPDMQPNDLIATHRAFLAEFNPNDPRRPVSSTIAHDRWGIVKKANVDVTQSLDSATFGRASVFRKQHHHLKEEDLMRKSQRINLSQSLDLENMAERRLREIVDQPHSWAPQTVSANRRPDFVPHPSMGQRSITAGEQVVTYSSDPHPRIILISSRLPAAEMLMDAVNFGVVPIVYEYEGETTLSLIKRIHTVLNGRTARSIGVFTHSDIPGNIHLVHDTAASLATLDHAEVREFFELATSLIQSDSGTGEFHVFVPIAASEEGVEMLVQLKILTGIKFSSPTGVIGSYNHINTEWTQTYDNTNPSHVYFCESKLNVWAAIADQASEASNVARDLLATYFKQTRKDVASQLTGQIIYDTVGLTNVYKNPRISQAIADAISELGANQNCTNPLEFLGRHLLSSAGVADQSPAPLKSRDTFSDFDSEIDKINKRGDDGDETKGEKEVEEEVEEEITGEVNDDIDGTAMEFKRGKNTPPSPPPPPDVCDSGQPGIYIYWPDGAESDGSEKKDVEKQETDESDKMIKSSPQQQTLSTSFKTRRLKRLTARQLSDHPEKRTPIAREILASESEYMSVLDAIRTVYVRPLQAAIKSNRAIISSHNIDIIFTDLLTMLDMSRILTQDLTKRLSSWDAQHGCIGDVFIKICTRLKVYTNFLNNYTIILDAIEKCKEQSTRFRSFLRNHERVPATKMLTLQELLLLPTRRINEYITLLSWFKTNTPRHHADHRDLHSVITTLTDLDTYIKECKQRVERDRQMLTLQKKITNCPSLLEANRFLVKHLDVAQLKPPTRDTIVPELRVYQQTAVLGLYLFNDALVLTHRTSRHFPFTRSIQYCYQFDASLGLTRLKISDIQDSKYVQNAFKMTTPKREWFCSASNADEKFSWIAILEKTIRSAVED